MLQLRWLHPIPQCESNGYFAQLLAPLKNHIQPELYRGHIYICIYYPNLLGLYLLYNNKWTHLFICALKPKQSGCFLFIPCGPKLSLAAMMYIYIHTHTYLSFNIRIHWIILNHIESIGYTIGYLQSKMKPKFFVFTGMLCGLLHDSWNYSPRLHGRSPGEALSPWDSLGFPGPSH